MPRLDLTAVADKPAAPTPPTPAYRKGGDPFQVKGYDKVANSTANSLQRKLPGQRRAVQERDNRPLELVGERAARGRSGSTAAERQQTISKILRSGSRTAREAGPLDTFDIAGRRLGTPLETARAGQSPNVRRTTVTRTASGASHVDGVFGQKATPPPGVRPTTGNPTTGLAIPSGTRLDATVSEAAFTTILDTNVHGFRTQSLSARKR